MSADRPGHTARRLRHPYQPASALGRGYSEEPVAENTYRLKFASGPDTTRESVQTYWLYRATELALAKGFDGFEILTPLPLGRSDSPPAVRPVAFIYVPIYVGPPSPTYSLEANIRLLKAPLDATPPRRFDARTLQDAIRPYVTAQNKCSAGNICSHRKDYLRPPRDAEMKPRGADDV